MYVANILWSDKQNGPMMTPGTLLLLPAQAEDSHLPPSGRGCDWTQLCIGLRASPSSSTHTSKSWLFPVRKTSPISHNWKVASRVGRGRVPPWIIAHCASYIQSPSSFPWTDDSTGSMYLISLSIYLKTFPIKSGLRTPSMWHCGVCFHLLLHIFSPSLSFILDIVHDVFFHTQGFTSTLSNLSVFSMTSRLHGLPRKFFLYPNHVKN